MRHSSRLLLTALALLLAQACVKNRPFSFSAPVSASRSGGIGGNPQVSDALIFGICGVIDRCNPGLSVDRCQAGLLSTSGFAAPLGLPALYTTMSSIVQAESTGAIQGNTAAGANCYNQIDVLDCADPTVQGAYVPSQANPFAGAPAMVPSASCNQVFSPGLSLEVPIEMVDYGLASNTSSTTFARTRTTLDTGAYDGTVSYVFEIVATNSDTSARAVSLVDGSGASVASISVAAGTANPTRVSVAMTPTSGANNYRVTLDGTGSANQLKVSAARIRVKQVGATRTKIYVPLLAAFDYDSSNADGPGAAVDNSNGASYSIDNEQYISLWKKNSAAFSQLAPGTPYTFEAVIGVGLPASAAYAALVNYTSGVTIASSEVSSASQTPTLVSASFADTATGFTDLNEMQVQLKNAGGNGMDAWVYHAGLWIQLSNLAHAEVYYRYSNTYWLNLNSEFQVAFQMTTLDSALFSSPTLLYSEETGHVSTVGTACSSSLVDIGTSDSAASGAVVAGSTLTFPGVAKSRQRTGPLSLVSGHRFIADMLPTAGPSGTDYCIIGQPRIVVSF
jgi:hypothetical protein